ncbi:MAG: AAA family ATPase [Gemmatimonadetes bacterium]|nr:MAG: AAA family ATPase [Gemmatimonadota bacterium]
MSFLDQKLIPHYVFDTYVVGHNNRLAFAAAKGVAENPAYTYNPLFIYSSVGLGKTHLLNAIGNAIVQSNPQMKVVYSSLEVVMESLTGHMSRGTLNEFRFSFEEIDVLLLDDVQFLIGREEKQEEFIRIFDMLLMNLKQLVFTSDRPPTDMTTLEERLRSRFQGGLIVDIQHPDLETRIAILQRKIKETGRTVPPEVVHKIAENVPTNVRELEGALNKVLAHALLTDREISLEVAREALGEKPAPAPEVKTLEEFQKEQEALSNEFSDFLSGVSEKVEGIAIEISQHQREKDELREKIKMWEHRGFEVDSIRQALRGTIEDAKRAYQEFEQNVHRLMELQDELSALEVPKEELFEVRRIQARLFDPAAVAWCEQAIATLREKLETEQFDFDLPLDDYHFEDYIVGESNKMVYRAAQLIAEAPGERYNPLFIHGGVGVGKTHLLNAIGNRILQKYPQRKVAYLSAEKFTNELIQAISDNQVEKFRAKYRSVDVLMIDDIQFLAGRERTQEEFFHSFNALYTVHKAIILTSDRSPKELTTLEDRLRSRFEGGLVAEIKAPTKEVRTQLIERILTRENITMEPALINHIADTIQTNIRELIGAVNRIVANCVLNDLPPTQEIVDAVLVEVAGTSKPAVTAATPAGQAPISTWEQTLLAQIPKIEQHWRTLDVLLHHDYLTDEYRVEKVLQLADDNS